MKTNRISVAHGMSQFMVMILFALRYDLKRWGLTYEDVEQIMCNKAAKLLPSRQ